MAQLEPVDPDRCQADRPNGHTAWTLGGVPGMVRCSSKPAVIVTENQPGPDGQIGSMSLCAECLDQFNKQMPAGYATVTVIKHEENA